MVDVRLFQLNLTFCKNGEIWRFVGTPILICTNHWNYKPGIPEFLEWIFSRPECTAYDPWSGSGILPDKDLHTQSGNKDKKDSGDLDTQSVWYSNGRNRYSSQLAWYSNCIQILDTIWIPDTEFFSNLSPVFELLTSWEASKMADHNAIIKYYKTCTNTNIW